MIAGTVFTTVLLVGLYARMDLGADFAPDQVVATYIATSFSPGLTALVMLFTFMSISVVLWVGGHDVLAGRMSGGQLSAFVFYALLVAGSVSALSEVAGELMRAAGATERLMELLAMRSSVVVADTPVALPEPPRRSVLIALVGAEEQGLLGSKFYAENPTFPSGKIAANINYDGGNIWGHTHDVTFIGLGKSTIDQLVTLIANEQGREVKPDQFADKGYFYRSDQFSFAKIGVPAMYLDTGTDFVDRPPGWGEERFSEWIGRHYHQPSDEVREDWVLDGLAEDAQLAFMLGAAGGGGAAVGSADADRYGRDGADDGNCCCCELGNTASTMCCGVPRSGFPIPRSMMSSPLRRASILMALTWAKTYGGRRSNLANLLIALTFRS